MLAEGGPEQSQRCTLSVEDEYGVTVQIDGRFEVVPWSAVTGISAGRAKLTRDGDQWVLVLAIEIEVAGEERLFIVGELEPAWVPLTAILHRVLPGIAPFEVWGAAAVTTTKPIELYQRVGRPA